MVTMGRWTGRETRFLRQALRLTVREFAEDLGVSPRTVSKWETAGAGRTPRPELQAALDTVLERATPAERERFSEAVARKTGCQRTVRPDDDRLLLELSPPSGDWVGPSSEAVAASAATAAAFAVWWETTSSGPVSLDLLLAELRRLASDYLDRPPEPVVAELRTFSNGLFNLLKRPQAPNYARDLHLLTGFANVLLGWLSSDVGQLGAAETHAHTATMFAGTSGSTELSAWVQAVRSKTAFWSGDLLVAARHALAGLDVAPATGVRVLLAAQAADAWSVLGAIEQADAAVREVIAARDALTITDTVGGLLSCSPAREANYVSGVHQQLGRLPQAVKVADQALVMSRAQRVRSYATEAQIQLNRVDIFLDQGDLDAVGEALGTVLRLPPDHRLHTLTRRVAGLAETLACPRFAARAEAQDLSLAAHGFACDTSGATR